MSGLSETTMTSLIDAILQRVSHPSRYLGGEVNTVRKNLDAAAVTVLLAFPDVYEVGMSHLGLQVLYDTLNRRDDVAAERAFAPWGDMESLLRERAIPLFSLESRRPVADFDIVGFSLQYELSYTNVLAMLDLARIPLRWQDRGETDPLVVAGGPCTFNPEPVAAFFDALVVGEGEEVVGELVEAYRRRREAAGGRRDLLEALAAIPGVYVPALHPRPPRRDPSAEAVEEGRSGGPRIVKRVIDDFASLRGPERLIVPFSQVVHDRINVEIARGCTRGCRFCQAGMTCRPVRERPRAEVLRVVERACECTGWEELSLLSLSSGDYTDIEGLLVSLGKELMFRRTALSFPSLRAETLHHAIIDAVRQERKTGFTIAPEAGTERLRRVINKNLSEREILETCRRVFSAGWGSIKLYFMIGLPTETMADLEGIVALAEAAWAQGKGVKPRPRVTVSVSTFIPKPHTPFQWEPMIDTQEIVRRQEFLRSRLDRRRLHFKWHDAQASWLEGVMARGDRRLADVVEEAFRRGCRFDGWSDQFRPEVWKAAFHDQGIDDRRYQRGFEPEEPLPWDHIDCGVDKDYLRQERERAFCEAETPDCRAGECNQCGVCDFSHRYPRIASSCQNPAEPKAPAETGQTPACKMRLLFSKRDRARLLGHLEMVRVFSRAARRAGLPLRYSQGYHPQPKISFGPALPLGTESLAEYVDLEFVERVAAEEAAQRLNSELPPGLMIHSGKEISLKTPAITDSLYEASYTVRYLPEGSKGGVSVAALTAFAEEFFRRPEFLITISRKGIDVPIDIRPLVTELSPAPDGSLVMTLRIDPGKSVRPDEVMKGVCALPEHEEARYLICKTRMKLREPWDHS